MSSSSIPQQDIPITLGIHLGSWRASEEDEKYLIFGHLNEKGELLTLSRALSSGCHERVELDHVTLEPHLASLKHDPGAIMEYCRICLENLKEEPPISKCKAVFDAKKAMEAKRLKELEHRKDIDQVSAQLGWVDDIKKKISESQQKVKE
ncbi:hypothetical protein ONS95_010296 [Cadophora gregata]|uniref:uncharacterized protein n=1 Tax=Cadophora gregata TaxID=51156 RepID=UPI0026DCFC4C|nr:uncharacterized protein ONS95_010296 [Cadophora gregata]KAK0122031.1 hypothetical protein ONS95_010296 [Cadophora gregata]